MSQNSKAPNNSSTPISKVLCDSEGLFFLVYSEFLFLNIDIESFVFLNDGRVVVFCQIYVTDVEKDQLMLTEFVSFVDSNGGKIHSSLFNDFFRRNTDWKLRLEGSDKVRNLCENSNGELIWAIDGEGDETVSTKDVLPGVNNFNDGFSVDDESSEAVDGESWRRGDDFSHDEVRSLQCIFLWMIVFLVALHKV